MVRIINDLHRLENEGYYHYIWRVDNLIISGKYDNWEQVTPIVNKELYGDDEPQYKGESAFRKEVKYARNFYEAGVFNDFNEEKYLKELQLQKDELYKVKRQVADQRREYNKLLASDGRADNLSNYLIEVADNLNKEQPLDFDKFISTYLDKEGVIVFSDWHYGMVTDNIWNKFNTEICKERVVKFVSKAKNYIKINQIKKLHILLLGDEIHGGIHTSARVASEEYVSEQLMKVSEIIAQAINELSNTVQETFVYNTYGNHARSIQNKNDSIHSDNMEKLIPWWLEQRFKERDDIHIMYSDFHEFIKLNVCGYNIVAAHGDLEGNFKNIGVTFNTIFSKLYGETIDYTITGDKHHLEEFEQFGIESILSRSLCGSDDYASDKRLYSSPGQTLIVFNNEDGRESTYNIKLN